MNMISLSNERMNKSIAVTMLAVTMLTLHIGQSMCVYQSWTPPSPTMLQRRLDLEDVFLILFFVFTRRGGVTAAGTNFWQYIYNYSAGKRDRGKNSSVPLASAQLSPLARAKEGPKAPTQAR